MSKVNLDVIKPWITAKINEILGIEDDVVIEFIMSQLEAPNLNPKVMQVAYIRSFFIMLSFSDKYYRVS